MIPDFNLSNVLPPYTSNPTDRGQMSPYTTSMSEFVTRFATSQARMDLIGGLIGYRQKLASFGFSNGFQWIDGSFVENVEKVRGLPPKDIDIVTFANRPDSLAHTWPAFVSENLDLFHPRVSKSAFHCDAYFIDLGKSAEIIVDDTRYFFGLFSHQRATLLWKGIISIPLASDDADAANLLKTGGLIC